MKQKLVIAFLTLALALSLVLTACGDDKTNGSTPDSSGSSSLAPASNLDQIVEEEEEIAVEAVEPAKKQESKQDNNQQINQGGDQEVQPDNQQEEQPAQEQKEQEQEHSSSSAVSSKASSSPSSSAASTEPFENPAYDEDHKPDYTISVTNTKTKKVYSASCSYATDQEEYAYVSFYLPGGEYDIAVYEYNEAKDKGDPILTAAFKNDIKESERKTIHVKYIPKSEKVEVTAVKSNRTQ